jgi:hypothetical protein
MNVEIGTEGAQFQDKEYIKGIFLQCGTTIPSITAVRFVQQQLGTAPAISPLDKAAAKRPVYSVFCQQYCNSNLLIGCHSSRVSDI